MNQLTALFPPHQVYVEPFFGGGAVFFGKTPSEKEIVNDLDSKLIQDYKRILQAPTSFESYKMPKTLTSQNRFLTETHTTIPDKVIESLLRRCNGFGGRYLETTGVTQATDGRIQKVTLHKTKLQRMGEYKARLEHATILNQDYRKVIKKYDSGKTFFFLDPPYEMSKGINYAKGSETFDFEELAKTLRGIKGDFLMTINDSPRIREVFKEFKIYPYVVKGHHSETSPIGSKDRKELLVSNYTLPKMKGGVKLGKAEARYNRALNKWNALTEKPSATQKELQKAWNELSLAEVDYQNAFQGITSEAAQELGQDLEAQQELIKRPEPSRQRAMTQREIEIEEAIQRRRDEERADEERLVERERNARWREQMRELEAQFEERRRNEQLGDGSGSGKPKIPKGYLAKAKKKAKAEGYETKRLFLADDGVHKLVYKTPEGKDVPFGSAKHGDHIIWSELEKKGEVPFGTSETKRRVFRKSHEAMKGSWKSNPYSPNALALAILW